MKNKVIKITGWTLTILLGLMFIMSAVTKLTLNEMAQEQITMLGLEANTFRILGLIELVSVILFIVPRTGVVGALLLMAYMGGAIATHLILKQSFVMGIALETMVWITAALRFPELPGRLFYGVKKIS
ncbi:MAG: DoxX family protein [Draconibacterium sp.]